MDIDLDLYRHEVRVSSNPLVRLSAIDVSPDHPQRTIVFIHGFGGQAEQWHFQMQKFAVENRVIALDLRGHGLSDKPGKGYDMPQVIQDLETVLTLLKVKGKIVLVGWTWWAMFTNGRLFFMPKILSGWHFAAARGISINMSNG